MYRNFFFIGFRGLSTKVVTHLVHHRSECLKDPLVQCTHDDTW